jgi:benzil reductase ((S)-benzoin forming)
MAATTAPPKRLAVVTGGGTGIGAALVAALARAGHAVIAVGRRPEPLQAVAAGAPALIQPVAADVATAAGRAAVAAAVSAAGRPVDFLVHNAGTIGAIAPLAAVSEADWRAAMATNLDGPLFLTQALLPHMVAGSRILHVSSGAAHNAVEGWGSYCASKAAFNMVYRLLKAELAPRGIAVGSARPGVVDSEMQAAIRAGDFPDRGRFVALHEKRRADAVATAAPPDGGLDDARNVAAFLHWLLTGPPADEFSAAEWDVRDKAHHARWTGTPLQ